jgi:hypothetical protein
MKLLLSTVVCVASLAPIAGQTSPEARAVTFLAREVPRWRAEHPCYSCHNNGDAARALIAASRAGFDVGDALSDTLRWLNAPGQWDANRSDGGFDNKPLAHIQFASALTSAAAANLASAAAVRAAADLVAADQQRDGSWPLDALQVAGSPTTYGTAVATWAARRTLVAGATPALQPAIGRADRWLRTITAQTIPDAAAVVLGLERSTDADAVRQRARALALLVRGQAPDGGWGPFATAASEPFDTAITVLALAAIDDEMARPAFSGGSRRAAVARARRFLIDRQLDDGSWPETTRPARQESYAQRISTAGWATLALLASKP